MRNFAVEAVVLRAAETGEGNRTVTAFAERAGIVWATAFGGMKGKLRGLVTPFNYGTMYLYRDPVRNYLKVTDFDVKSYFQTLRESLAKYYAASLWAEFLLRTKAGGGSLEDGPTGGDDPADSSPDAGVAGLFRLFTDCLFLLDGEGEEEAPYLTIQFLWRASGAMGFRPPVDSCIGCGSEISPDGIHSYSRLEGGFLCGDCRARPGEGQRERVVELDAGAVRYLERTEPLGPRAALRVRLEARSLAALKAIVYDVAERIVDGPLKTIETGRGIL